ncbi:MAG: hypothetical protein BHV99_01220 [Clostridium sp. 26_21]|nr:MAG: hypothetical protein BHV99_01220 [Clostridium sp. 26_21]
MINKKSEKGVTLIILAVTIIVMLIIAGISFSSMSGQGNTINQAQEKKDAVNIKEERDAIKIAVQETLISDNKGELKKENLLMHLEQHIKIANFEYRTSDKQYKFQVISSGTWYCVDLSGTIYQIGNNGNKNKI